MVVVAAKGRDARERVNYSDDGFYAEVPNERAAHDLFLATLHPEGLRCPTCYGCGVAPAEAECHLPVKYRCHHCRGQFTVLTNTLMEGLDISLQEWWWSLFVFTSRPMISAPQDLASRMGWDEALAREAFLRLLMAAARPPHKLREPAEMDCTLIDCPEDGFKKVNVIAMIGRTTSTVGGLEMIPDQTQETIFTFVGRHLYPGMPLFTDSHGSNKGIREMEQYFVNHSREYVKGPASTNSVEGLWRRLKVFLRRCDWLRDGSLTHCLAGVEWWERNRELSHHDRIVDLARGMKGKRPQRIVDQFNFVRQEELELSTPRRRKRVRSTGR